MAKSFLVEILETETLSKFWSTLTKITLNYTRSDGQSQVLVREVNDHGAGAAVLAYDPNRKTVLLVKQMRIAAYMVGYDEPMIEVVPDCWMAMIQRPARFGKQKKNWDSGSTIYNL